VNDDGEKGGDPAGRSAVGTPVRLETYELSPAELATTVVPTIEPLPYVKEGNAYRLARGLLIGLAVISVAVLVMLARLSYPEFHKEGVELWQDILIHVKEIVLFVLGAVVGFWFSK
jgi:hypothetical protein